MTQTLPFSLPEGLSRIVAEATASLPPLTKATDEVFLRMFFEETVYAFWRMYIDWLPKEVRDAYVAAFEEPTGDAIIAWHKKHADFYADTAARAKAEMIVVSLAQKLTESLPKAYAQWSPEEAAVTIDTWVGDAEDMAQESASHSS